MKAKVRKQKVTMNVRADFLEQARKQTGKGITETVNEGLRLLATQQAYQAFRALRGKFPDLTDWRELKYDRT